VLQTPTLHLPENNRYLLQSHGIAPDGRFNLLKYNLDSKSWLGASEYQARQRELPVPMSSETHAA
jgi:hypothetical protein